MTETGVPGRAYRLRRWAVSLALLGFLLARPVPNTAAPSTRYVGPNGTNAGACTSASSPCRTIAYGISQMSGGDTLIVKNGTYTEETPIRFVPNGNPGPDGTPRTADDVYTTVRAETDFGVTIDGSGWPDNWKWGIRLENKSFITIRGFIVYSNQQKATNSTMAITDSDHIKIIRCGFGYGEVLENSDSAGFGANNDYTLMEESFAFGGARYQFLNYWSNHVVMRRNVARNDYFTGSLQSAAFTNYDSVNTVWQNNIAIDSNSACCTGHSGLYAAFFNENKTDHAPDTTQEFHGNIVLNYKTTYGAHLDWLVTGTRHMSDNIYWDTTGGYHGEEGSGTAGSWPVVRNFTVGATTGSYSGANGNAGAGTGMSMYDNRPNSVRSSIFANNRSYGVADYVNGDYNAFSGNGANYGGTRQAVPGPHDITSQNIVYHPTGNPNGSLKYLPRGPEPGSALASAGENGGRVGAQVLWKIGLDGTLYGEPGWNIVRSPENGYGRPEDRLWPWPNEAAIKAAMAAYNKGGLSGPRGFAAPGNGLYGGPRTLTSYIWEYLGAPCPQDICGGGAPGPMPAPPGLLRILLGP